MPSGGARVRSGPAADPNSLRSARSGDVWVTLPFDGFSGPVPEFVLPLPSARELELWGVLWRKPQAFMWAKLGLEFDVAAYVRAFVESTEPEAAAGLKTAVLRMAAELGLSLPGMASLKWRFADDEVEAKRAGSVVPVKSARDRLRALNA